MEKEETVEKVYNDFWKSLVEVNGQINMTAIKNELYDFHHMLEEVPKVYMEVSDGRISKSNTYAFEVISEFRQNHWNIGVIQDDIRDVINNSDLTTEEKLSEIVDYLEIEKT